MPHIPVHPSAQKRRRQNEKRREYNRGVKTRVRTAVKTAAETIEGKDAAQAQAKLREAISALDKAVSKGALHRNTVSRKISRLSAQFHKTHASQSQPAQQSAHSFSVSRRALLVPSPAFSCGRGWLSRLLRFVFAVIVTDGRGCCVRCATGLSG